MSEFSASPISSSSSLSRRRFLTTAAVAGAAVTIGPKIITAAKTDKQIILGSGDYKYEVQHNWPELPSKFSWQTTHSVAIDKAGNLYVIHQGNEKQTDHPSIFVFDSAGKFIRAFGQEFQGGGHGIEVRQEGNDEYLYVTAYKTIRTIAKTSLTGEVVWRRQAPMKSKVYAAGEDAAHSGGKKGRNRFQPTNIAFLDDGGFLLADGYGSFYIHRYDKDANWVSSFGGSGKGEGKFNTPHGIWVDRRADRDPSIVVCDRANNTLQIFDMNFEYQKTIPGFGLPANADTWKDLLLIPELEARVSLLNSKNEIVCQLGDDRERVAKIKDLRSQPDKWEPGKFVHPHDACFDAEGNIYVAEWVSTGRITKLKRLS